VGNPGGTLVAEDGRVAGIPDMQRFDRYGIPDADRFPHRCRTVNGKGLIQFPISTLRMFGMSFPVGGEGYFRLLPSAFTRLAINRVNEAEHKPAVIYIHPWEVDPAQSRVAGPLVARFRHYTNLHTTEGKLHRLLDAFTFRSLRSSGVREDDKGKFEIVPAPTDHGGRRAARDS
jgi:hypothetical protein